MWSPAKNLLRSTSGSWVHRRQVRYKDRTTAREALLVEGGGRGMMLVDAAVGGLVGLGVGRLACVTVSWQD